MSWAASRPRAAIRRTSRRERPCRKPDSFRARISSTARSWPARTRLSSARDARNRARDGCQTLGTDGPSAGRAHPVSPRLDVPERGADLPNLVECHRVESFEDLVVFELSRTFLRVAVVRLSQVAF